MNNRIDTQEYREVEAEHMNVVYQLRQAARRLSEHLSQAYNAQEMLRVAEALYAQMVRTLEYLKWIDAQRVAAERDLMSCHGQCEEWILPMIGREDLIPLPPVAEDREAPVAGTPAGSCPAVATGPCAACVNKLCPFCWGGCDCGCHERTDTTP